MPQSHGFSMSYLVVFKKGAAVFDGTGLDYALQVSAVANDAGFYRIELRP